jgi:hypothetical protein
MASLPDVHLACVTLLLPLEKLTHRHRIDRYDPMLIDTLSSLFKRAPEQTLHAGVFFNTIRGALVRWRRTGITKALLFQVFLGQIRVQWMVFPRAARIRWFCRP